MGIAVGIDLGTSNSVVSAFVDGRTIVLTDEDGCRLQPSVVAFDGSRATVGRRAQEIRQRNPEYTVNSVKRLIGRRYRSPEIDRIRRMVPWGVASGPSGDARARVQGRIYSAEEISAHILRHMRTIAQQALGIAVDAAVITVPAYFNDHQRQATRDAAEIAGLQCLRIINEPTAAALAHGFDRGGNHHLVVFDLGGGTFDISVLKVNGDVFEVIATAGDTFLGGDDFDAAIADFIMSRLKIVNGLEIEDVSGGRGKLMEIAEKAKCSLSSQPEVTISETAIGTDAQGNKVDLNLRLNQKLVMDLVMPLIQRCFVVCDDALGQSGLHANQVDAVLMVGGMTRFPLIRESVENYFGQKPVVSINPDEVVSQGAAIQAYNLSTFQDDPAAVLLDVTSQTLGIRTIGGFLDPLIPRNTPIPYETCKHYFTTVDQQTQVRVEVFQGADKKAENNHLLGEFVLTGLRAALRGEVRVRITFAIDADGIVKVSAEDTESGNQVDMVVHASSRMPEEERERIRKSTVDASPEEEEPLRHDEVGSNPFQEEELDVATDTTGIRFAHEDDDLDIETEWME